VFTNTVYADTAEVVEGECEQVKAW
jgi:hypothetical protein